MASVVTHVQKSPERRRFGITRRRRVSSLDGGCDDVLFVTDEQRDVGDETQRESETLGNLEYDTEVEITTPLNHQKSIVISTHMIPVRQIFPASRKKSSRSCVSQIDVMYLFDLMHFLPDETSRVRSHTDNVHKHGCVAPK